MAESWPELVYRNLKEAGITQMAYVPDAGHSQLIKLFEADAEVEAISLTTEEEGVAMLGGAWLGGAKGVLLMQSSGVGNCINMLALIQECRMPFLCLVTMRGEWGEFNPWQCPMGQSAEPRSRARALRAAGGAGRGRAGDGPGRQPARVQLEPRGRRGDFPARAGHQELQQVGRATI